MKIPSKQDIKKIPKVDLHLHLLGSFRRADLWDLCKKYYPEMTYEEFKHIMSFNTFDEFSYAWKFKNTLVQTYDDFLFLMKGFIASLKENNIVYVEPAIALFELAPLDPIKLLDIAYNELKKSDIEFSFIMDLIRGDGYEELSRQYQIYKSVSEKYQIRGVGLAGNEQKHGLDNSLIPIFKQAKKDGFGITIHAGEHGDLLNIEKAITQFGADRIGHANYLDSNGKLSRLISDNKIFLEFIPSSIESFHSNGLQHLSTDIYKQLFSEQLNDYYGENISNFHFNINSDDAGMYDSTLSDVIEKIVSHTGASIGALTILNFMAIKASFAPESTKEKLINKILKSMESSSRQPY